VKTTESGEDAPKLQLLEQLDRQEREQELIRAYDILGRDGETSVEPFFEAQGEVARRC
jgi:hypothetical protein